MSGIGRTNSGSVKQVRIPRQYQEVEYLQSSGAQGFSTGLKFTPLTTIEVEFQWTACGGTSGSTGYDTDIIGAEGGSNGFAILLNTYQQSHNRIIIKVDDASVSSQSYSTNTRYKAFVNRRSSGVGIDINNIEWNYKGNQATSNYPLTLFCINKSGTFGSFAYCRIYSCKIWSEMTLLRNFVPCYRKSDSVAGMYDLVNNVFYTNGGTGTFAVGSDVEYG